MNFNADLMNDFLCNDDKLCIYKYQRRKGLQHNRLSARRTWHGRVPAPHQIASALGLYMAEASVVSAAAFVSVSVA